MQFLIAFTLLASSFPTHSPSQVKEELDAHPWRPDPAMTVTASPNSNAMVAKPATTPETPLSASTGEVWQLQIAALSSLDAAKAEQKRVEKVVGPGKVQILSEGSVNRVRLGAYPSKEAAEAAREELRPKGIEGFPVRKP
jgi:cell division septation protein DedD